MDKPPQMWLFGKESHQNIDELSNQQKVTNYETFNDSK